MNSPLLNPSGALAVIPARGGSKGIPGKNLSRIGGISLVGRCVIAAQASQRVCRVVVSTDDNAIAAEATRLGAEVVRRPPAIAGDTASSESAILHVLDNLERQGPLPEQLVFLQCTSPFTNGEQIDRVLSSLDAAEVNSSFSVAPWHGFLWREDGRAINHDPQQPRKRRQDLEPAYIETGAIYALKIDAFRREGSRFCPPLKPVVIEDSGPEIDTPKDLEICRQIELLRKSRE